VAPRRSAWTRTSARLEVGKKADVILLDLSQPWYRPIRQADLFSNIVYNSNGSDVTDVFVDGAHVVAGKLVKTVNAEEIMRECQERADRIWANASRNW
jgi:5-methylthioadenosine/S-adenosylhomocysteine deaminase